MPTYGERARALWQSLTPADKQRIHGFLTLDGSASWRFDAEKLADLCESHPEIPLALRAVVATDKRKAGPNESSDDCLARVSRVFELAETVARTIPNRFGEVVTEEAYKEIHFKLVQAGRRNGWKAVPLATIMQIIDLYTLNITITPPPPDPYEALGEETREEKLRKLWEAAKLWSAPRDCGRLQRLLGTIEKDLPDNMKPIVKERDALADEAEAHVVALRDDLEEATSEIDGLSRRLENAKAAKEIQSVRDKLSICDRTRRSLCEDLQVQEAKSKYLRWGGRPLGRFDPFDDIRQAFLDGQQTDGDAATAQD